jgi:hypothetical protein
MYTWRSRAKAGYRATSFSVFPNIHTPYRYIRNIRLIWASEMDACWLPPTVFPQFRNWRGYTSEGNANHGNKSKSFFLLESRVGGETSHEWGCKCSAEYCAEMHSRKEEEDQGCWKMRSLHWCYLGFPLGNFPGLPAFFPIPFPGKF